MKHYCLGFVFTENDDKILLLSKERPAWQKGLLNGIGGHVEEGETFPDAMIREGREEANLYVDWTLIAHIGSSEWSMGCFRATDSYAVFNAPPVNDVGEHLGSFAVRDILLGNLVTIPNLRWLVPMALQQHEAYWPFNLTDTLPIGVQP